MENELLLVNVYGPNKDDPIFYHTLQEIIKSYKNNIIAVGDWNLVMDPNIDSYNYIHANSPKVREAVENTTGELGQAMSGERTIQKGGGIHGENQRHYSKADWISSCCLIICSGILNIPISCLDIVRTIL